MKTHFYVYRCAGGAPTMRHETLADAEAEARRLASKYPGVQFEILQCLGVASTTAVSVSWCDGRVESKLENPLMGTTTVRIPF